MQSAFLDTILSKHLTLEKQRRLDGTYNIKICLILLYFIKLSLASLILLLSSLKVDRFNSFI
jgi:hypothetical protein